MLYIENAAKVGILKIACYVDGYISYSFLLQRLMFGHGLFCDLCVEFSWHFFMVWLKGF